MTASGPTFTHEVNSLQDMCGIARASKFYCTKPPTSCLGNASVWLGIDEVSFPHIKPEMYYFLSMILVIR